MTKEEILQKVAAGEITPEAAGKLLLTEPPKRGQLYCKVSEKGAITIFRRDWEAYAKSPGDAIVPAKE